MGVNFWYLCTKFCYICWFFVHVLPGQSWLKQAKVDFNSKLLHEKSLSILLALTVEQPTWEAYSTFPRAKEGGLSLYRPKLHNDCLIFREIDSYNAFIEKVKNNLLNSEFELKYETREKNGFVYELLWSSLT